MAWSTAETKSLWLVRLLSQRTWRELLNTKRRHSYWSLLKPFVFKRDFLSVQCNSWHWTDTKITWVYVCVSVCLSVRTKLSSTITTAIFVRSSSNLVHGSHMWKRRLNSVDKFPGSMAPLIYPKTSFFGRTSSLSQCRAFQRLSWRPIKLSSQILARISGVARGGSRGSCPPRTTGQRKTLLLNQ